MVLKIKYEGFINQLLILTAVLLLIPIMLSVYLFHMVHSTELGMIQSHRKVLEEAMDYLDRNLNGSFENILSWENAQSIPRREQEKVINQYLKPILDKAAQKYPGLDMGYYSKDFDVILDGDNQHLYENFSTRRKRNFDDALENKNLVFEVLGQSENGQLEAYRQIMRDGKVVGAVWANESIKQIYRKIDEIQKVTYGVVVVGIFLAFGGAFSLINKFARSVNDIKKGLNVMGGNPAFLLPKASGELGQITDAINEMYKKLIDVQNYNDLILTCIDEGIVAVDKTEKIISINSAAARMLDLDGSCMGREIGEIFPEDSPFVVYLKSTLHHHKVVKDINWVYEESPEASRHLLISTSLMVNARQDLGAILHFRDITGMTALQENIRRQERLASIGKLVAGVAHEIRSPLTSIAGYVQFWSKDHVPSPKSLSIVSRELNRVSAVTDKLLEFARPSRAVLENCDLNSLVKRMVQFFIDAHGRDIEITCKFAGNLPPAFIDAGQIEQVLSNILYNAYQAMAGKGSLEISTWLDGEKNMLAVSVEDNGCGIPEEVMPKMFEPFFSTKSKGTGLGLAIAHEIMEAHNGQIEVESEPNRGTTVRIFLLKAERGDADA